jgi:hypothetical protein
VISSWFFLSTLNVRLIWGLRGIFIDLIMVPKIMYRALKICDTEYLSLMHEAGDRNILFMPLTVVIHVTTGILRNEDQTNHKMLYFIAKTNLK